MKTRAYKLLLANNSKLIISLTLLFLLVTCSFYFLKEYLNDANSAKTVVSGNNIINSHINQNKKTNPLNNSYATITNSKQAGNFIDQSLKENSKNTLNITSQNKCNKDAIFVENEETPIFSEPLSNAAPIVDKKGSPRFIDPRYDLTIIETKNDWVKVSSLKPNWPPEAVFKNVWIKKSNLSGFNIDEETNKCLYVDFTEWEDKAKSAITKAKESAYNILKNDPRCDRIVKGGFLGAGQRYYLTCYPSDGAKPYHYWFSLLKASKIEKSVERINDDTATSACNISLEKIIKNAALLETYSDTPPETEENHQVRIKTSTFEGIGSAWHITIYFTIDDGSEQKAYCYVGPSGIAEITMY